MWERQGAMPMKDILIVEDNVEERERLRDIFTGKGYSVVCCDAAEKAEGVLATQGFRLVILDIGLGDKSGSYLFNQINALQQRPQIIIFTGNPSVHLKERFLQSGAVDYVVKGSADARKDAFLKRALELIGDPQSGDSGGIDLEKFVSHYVAESSRNLFYDSSGTFAPCEGCGGTQYSVVFSHKPQLPPEIIGEIRCTQCGTIYEGSVG